MIHVQFIIFNFSSVHNFYTDYTVYGILFLTSVHLFFFFLLIIISETFLLCCYTDFLTIFFQWLLNSHVAHGVSHPPPKLSSMPGT